MTDAAHDRATLAPPARRRVLDALVASPEPLDAAAVAQRVGLHVTTARFHLERLVDAGLAGRRAVAERRRGRPRVLYAPSGPPRDEASREQLIRVLATALAHEDDHLEAATRAGRRWAATFPPPDAGEPLPGLVAVLDRLGFDPEPADDSPAIALRACPFRDAAREHPDVVCAAHRGLIEQLVAGSGSRARLLPFVEPELCLVALERVPAGASA